jgi:hypothetical protein
MTELTYPHIKIARDEQLEEHAGKPVYYIFNKTSGTAIGRILYYPTWRRWVANFSEESVWSEDCLGCVREAIKVITKEAVK